jgi:hypothetical protein
MSTWTNAELDAIGAADATTVTPQAQAATLELVPR